MALERRADVVRSRLAGTLAALERRRREWSHPTDRIASKLRTHARTIAWIGAGALVALVAAVGVTVVRARQQRKNRGHERIRALQRLWNHPERIGRDEQPPFVTRLIRSVVVSLFSAAGSEAIHIVARRPALPERVQP
jgi:hypothetical protein